ncbi:MAG: phytanoyl-CoA dioxygenase family protein [Candidatus Latescibacterota bacterium]|nr:phytanoyl-CoA dioxygenase family protein [Candidatus Latescibacterota bacterium]
MGLSEKQKKHWLEKGYVVVPNAVPVPLLRDVIRSIEDFVGKRMDQSSDWYKDPVYPGGIINMNHNQALWETRQYPFLHEIFTDIWGTKKLTVSQDRTNMNPPANETWDYDGTIHWDMISTQQPLPFKVQGLLVLTDTAENQGGFQCVPGFHLCLEEWAKTQPIDRPPRHPDTRGMNIKNIPASAGDFIIWHSALPHGNSRNVSNLPRLCQYITMNPAIDPFAPSPVPLVHTDRSEIAKAFGLPEGLLESWLRAQRDADKVIVRGESVRPYEIIPNLIRIELDDGPKYVNESWGKIIDSKSILISREHASTLGLSIQRNSPDSNENIFKFVQNMPRPRFQPILTDNQLARIPFLLGEQNGVHGKIWNVEEIADLIRWEFGLKISTQEASLTTLGKKLANVNPW